MTYVLIGHEMKHAVEEMLLHLLPAAVLARAEESPDTGDRCISTLHERDGRAYASAEAVVDGRRFYCERDAAVSATDELARKRTVTELVKTTLYEAIAPGLPEAPVWGGPDRRAPGQAREGPDRARYEPRRRGRNPARAFFRFTKARFAHDPRGGNGDEL